MDQRKGYVDQAYLQVLADLLKQNKQRSYALMHLRSSHAVLDVGCGPGTDTLPLAELVGPTGSVVGVDFDAAMVATATERATAAGVDAWVSHRH